MDSVASRILKARQYAEEKDKRLHVTSFSVDIEGEHDRHSVSYDSGKWTCSCEEYQLRGICAHIMTMEQILGDAVEPATIRMAA